VPTLFTNRAVADAHCPADHLKGAFIPIGGLTSGFPHQGSFGERGPWGSVWPDNVHETGVSLDGQSGSSIVAAEARQVEKLEESLVTGPIQGFVPDSYPSVAW
jgi:hypothetical protein